MALIKEIELSNGVTVNYHRIVSVNNITNHSSVIEVASYTSKAKREEEKNCLANNLDMDVFISTEYMSIPYSAERNVISAYDYLKTLEKYSNAEND